MAEKAPAGIGPSGPEQVPHTPCAAEEVAVEAKSLLRPYGGVDDWFWVSAALNPYRGCAHGCTYCDGRSERYRVADFDSRVEVKVNAPGLLAQELSRMGYRRRGAPRAPSLQEFGVEVPPAAATEPPRFTVGLGGGVTDAYQPVEARRGLTRRLLEVLVDHEFPVHVITKSTLVERDLDLLWEAGRRAWAAVSFTVTTLDEDVRRALEPRSPSSRKRLEAMRRVRDAGVVAGVTLMPVVPYITDGAGELEALVAACAAAGAQYVLYGAMTLRDRQQAFFYRMLRERYPDLVEKYDALYRGRYTPDAGYMRELNLRLWAACRRSGIPTRAPRPMPRGCIPENVAVSALFYDQAWLLEVGGDHHRAKPYHRAARSIDALSRPLSTLRAGGALGGLRGVGDRFAVHIAEALETGDFRARLEQVERLDRLAGV